MFVKTLGHHLGLASVQLPPPLRKGEGVAVHRLPRPVVRRECDDLLLESVWDQRRYIKVSRLNSKMSSILNNFESRYSSLLPTWRSSSNGRG